MSNGKAKAESHRSKVYKKTQFFSAYHIFELEEKLNKGLKKFKATEIHDIKYSHCQDLEGRESFTAMIVYLEID